MSDTINGTKSAYPKQKLCFSLPLPVSQNHAYINTRGGGKKLNTKASQWMATAKMITSKETIRQKWKKEKDVWYVVETIFYMPDKRCRDNSNLYKLMLDALEGIVYDNDYFVLPRTISVELDRINPRVELKIFSHTK